MMTKGIKKRMYRNIALLIFLLLASIAAAFARDTFGAKRDFKVHVNLAAQKKTFIREYVYKASETDSKVTSRQKALTEVKALLIEELGIYVESYVNHAVTDKDGVITKDFFTNEIKTLSAGTTETKILEERWDGYEYFIKAEIVADPEEVVRRINQTLSLRKSSEAIDSLKILLQSSGDELILKNKEVTDLKAQLAAEQKKINSTQASLNGLNQQLIESKRQLATYQAQEKHILSEIEEIEQTMKQAANKAVANVRIGMTPEEVVRVCGKPRVIEHCDNMNYGAVWVFFDNGIVNGIVDAKDYRRGFSARNYKSMNVKLILQ
jgi:DNA repair exonuclease SbcCD ATPase subunit